MLHTMLQVESAYTVSTLSPTLSFFEVYVAPPTSTVGNSEQELSDAVRNLKLGAIDSAKEFKTRSLEYVLIQCARRCCIYPYLRMFKLAKKVFTDVTKILLLGQRAVLRCFLQIRKIFELTDTHYLLNKLYIDDYCVWLQSLEDHGDVVCTAMGRECNTCKRSITEDCLGLGIDEIEQNADIAVEKQIKINNLQSEAEGGRNIPENSLLDNLSMMKDEGEEESSSSGDESDEESHTDSDNVLCGKGSNLNSSVNGRILVEIVGESSSHDDNAEKKL